MEVRVESLLEEGRVVYLSASENGNNFVDAGVFMVANKRPAYAFLEEWFSYSRLAKDVVDADNAAVHYMLAERVEGYDGRCNGNMFLPGPQRPCLEPFLKGVTDFGEIVVTGRLAVNAPPTVHEAHDKLRERGALCVHGHQVGTFFHSSRELYNCSDYAISADGADVE
jgi:hypothetical protein